MDTTSFLAATISRFIMYKELADKTFAQLTDADFFRKPSPESNSIAIVIQHMAGNMLSRWTDFLTTDGEKEWRNRDTEFEERLTTRQELLAVWEKGWNCLFTALRGLGPNDLLTVIHIRHEGLTVMDAIIRQLAHYPYHVGQIVHLGKWIKDKDWQNLSIAKGQSQPYNQQVSTTK
jgi:hypothetical protein